MNAPVSRTDLERIDASRLALQVAVFMPNGRILGSETFRLTSFQGQDGISEPFEYNLELRGNTRATHNPDLDFRTLLGRPVTAGLQLPDPDGEQRFRAAIQGRHDDELALFNGIVAAFGMGEPGVYRLTMRPALWKLSLANRYQAYPNLTLREAVSEVLRRHDVAHRYVDGVDAAHDPSRSRSQDWLQAGESDLDFVRRLLGKVGLFYFFEHRGDAHTMVITAGDNAYLPVHADGHALRYTHTGLDALGLEQEDSISQYSYQETLATSHVSGVYVRQEAVWEKDGIVGYQPYPAAAGSGDLPFHQYKVYPYGLTDMEAKYLADTANRALDASRGQLSGTAHCPRFRAGHTFRMTGSVMGASQPMPVQPSLENRDYVLTQVKHQASLDGSYQCDFQATEKAPVAAFNLQDTQQGALLATVVAYDEGHQPNDWRYYPRDVYDPQSTSETDTQASPATLAAKGIMVRFATQAEGEAPVWVRVPSSMPSVPEIGSMVLVSRGNDESELPELQNTVSSGGTRTITPDGWTAHSSVGHNYSTTWGDGVSIRFGRVSPDDLPTAVGIVDAAYKSGDYRDVSYSRGASYSYSTSEDERNGILGYSESYGCNYSKSYARETKSWSETGYSYSDSKIDNSDSLYTLTGTSNSTNTINISNSTNTTAVSNNSSITGQSSDTSVIGLQTSLSAIGLQTSAGAIGMQNSANVTGLQNSVSATGIQNSMGVTGMSNGLSATGLSNNVSLNGISNQVSLTGVSNSTSLTGVSNSTSLTGVSSQMSITGNSTNMNVGLVSTDISAIAVTNKITFVGAINTVEIDGPEVKIDLNGVMQINIDGARTSLHVPALDLVIEVGIGIRL